MAVQRSTWSWLVLTLVLLGCTNNSTPSTESIRGEYYVPDGELIYLNNCASCHGSKGDEGTSGAFDLTSSVISRDSIKKIILNGRKGMPPFKYIISDSVDVEALLNHTEKLKK